jgi:cytidine deaminase
MKQDSITISITEFNAPGEMPDQDQELINAAFAAAKKAYAPYSGFTVGAALRLANNLIVTGNNQENAAYPSGLCAERVALFYASAEYPGQAVDTIAVVARVNDADLSEPVTPCGSCRQVMAEYEQLSTNKMRVILATEMGRCILVEGMENLLPLAFLAKHLNK